ncbi:dienelactone hydrolase family protein [Aeromicrobium sp. Leaf350]|uniref:dienelactone hydrolase family protein n=1 Tax=Aeromicrobium sp. Leaf350 TaxID=2876565 RepID=UPI001E5E9D37|nr:dienelactone hydrolase family protein [Aeromicrobium sp. Leaf350]
MAEIVFFHHAGGLTAGVRSFADTLRAAGHTVHTPDLFEGRTFTAVEDGVAFAQSLGPQVVADRVADAVQGLPTELVYGGASLGSVRAAEQVFERPGARGAFFLYGAVAPSWWESSWPAGVPVQAHQAEVDPWREVEAEEELAGMPGAEVFVYPVTGHLFAEAGHPEFDAEASKLLTSRVLDFLAAIDAA